MAQHGAQGHSLPYAQPGFDASLAAGMASLGLQGSLIDNLHSTQWQARLLQSLSLPCLRYPCVLISILRVRRRHSARRQEAWAC